MLLLVGEHPVDPGELVVLAVDVVVSVLGAAEFVAVAIIGTPWLSRRVVRSSLLAGLQVVDRGLVGRDPSAPQFHDRLWLSPSRLPSRLASLCLSLQDTRSRSVKPSWAVMKLIEATAPAVVLVEVAAGEP